MRKPAAIADMHPVHIPPAGLLAAGPPRPSSPAPVFAEDFSLLVRFRRIRIARLQIRVLS